MDTLIHPTVNCDKDTKDQPHAATSPGMKRTPQTRHPRYLDREYIVRAREAEIKHHMHTIHELQRRMERLTGEFARELQQHHAKIHELYRLEQPLLASQPKPSSGSQGSSSKKATVRRIKQTPTPSTTVSTSAFAAV